MTQHIRITSKALLIFGMAFYALVAPKLLSTYSLCIGLDGHIELESVSNPCCGPQVVTAQDAGTLVHGHEDPCGTCTDISLAPDVEHSALPKVIEGLRPPVLVLQAPVLFSRGSDANRTVFHPPPLWEPNLVFLRTIRLLV